MDNCVLKRITEQTKTEFWTDSCDVPTLKRAVGWGATGATSNPIIVFDCIKTDTDRWIREIAEIRKKEKNFTEDEIAWELIRKLALEAMPILRYIYDASNRRTGRITIQVNPKYFTDPEKMITHAREIATWGENIAIKIPAVEAGFIAMEELVAEGLSILSTVQFTLSQAIATAEAFERGYKRAQSNGIDIFRQSTWAAIMVGRLDDHLRDEQKAKKIPVNTEDIHYASLAVFKKIAHVFKERHYRTKLMAAAIRGSYHCMRYVGDDVVVTLPPSWQEFINSANEPITPNAIGQEEPVEKIENLRRHFPDFDRAYEEGGMNAAEFVKFGSTHKTLRQFISGYEELLHFVRNCML